MHFEHDKCEAGGRVGVRARPTSGFKSLHPAYEGERGVHYRIRETVCGNFVYVSCGAAWSLRNGDRVDPERDAQRTRDRALRKLKERVLTLGADRLLTLTYRENMQDFDEAKKHFRKFVARMRKAIKGWKFVAVAETQERGAIHWHLAVKGFQDVKTLRAEWLRVVGDGNIDVTPPRKGGAPKIADYISKYLGKGFELTDKPRYSHFYITSRGLTAETYGYDLVNFHANELQAFIAQLIDERGSKVRTRWWRDDHAEYGGAKNW